LFNEHDDRLLAYLNEEGQSIEPEWCVRALAAWQHRLAVLVAQWLWLVFCYVAVPVLPQLPRKHLPTPCPHVYSARSTPCCRYMPIMPVVLINGADGIGTGWSTSIPNFNPRDIIANLLRMLNGEVLLEMTPWYKGFNGTIVEVGGWVGGWGC
jgi:hypothetical protein